MGKQSRKEKYNQWGLEDSLTLAEKEQEGRKRLEELEKERPTARETNRTKSQKERLKKTGYVI